MFSSTAYKTYTSIVQLPETFVNAYDHIAGHILSDILYTTQNKIIKSSIRTAPFSKQDTLYPQTHPVSVSVTPSEAVK